MASLIKNQILKHLSKFTKNLSPDKIHLSTLKGEGEMSNLELDEVVLMELLDLPTWLRLSSATCNKVAIKIQWTKLKAQPICLYLDEIVVEMETCDKPRQPSVGSNLSSYSSGGKYGFAERIIDGMFVSINSVIVNFKAPTFQASIQISRIIIQSKTPLWQTGDLRLTRIKDELRGEILIFKEAEWQTLRIEANALDTGDPTLATTPLRLIANQSKTRITIKKRLNDCGMVASRVQLNLDDLLWVLTDSQLKAAIIFVNSLKEVIQKSTQQAKLRATDKLKSQGPPVPSPQTRQQQPTQQPVRPQQGSKSQMAMAKLFTKYDVVETSYHLHTGRVDLHLCDGMAPDSGGRRRVEGGAMQITIHKMSLDHYPFHLAGVDRTHWVKHDENMLARNAWAQDLLNVFREEVRRVRETLSTPPPSPGAPPYPDQAPKGRQGRGQSAGRSQKTPPSQKLSAKLLESCMVLRIEDFVLYRVSTAKDNKRNSPKKFLASDKKQLLLPQDMSSIHVEYTDYYFPEGIHFPVPHANLFVVLNPLRLNLDWITLLWLNTFSLSLLQSLELPESEGPRIHTDIKIDALMPRIVLPSEVLIKGQPDRPDSLQIQASKLTLTNCHIEHKASLPELGALLQTYENSHFFCNSKSDFPKRDEDFVAIPTVFRRHALKDNDTFLNSAIGDIVIGRRMAPAEVAPSETRASDGTTYYSMSTDSLKLDATKDVWCLSVDQFWMEFLGVPTAHGRPVAFVESFPLTLWLANPLLSRQPRGTGGHGARNPHRPLERSGSNHLLKQYYSGEGDRPQGYVNGDAGYPAPGSRDGSPAGRSHRSRPVHDKACADMHMLLKVGGKVNIQLNHYQYVFLMRLVETVGKFSKDLAEDTAAILRGPPPEKTMVLAVKLRELELALVCPPIPEMPGSGLESGSREDSDELKMLDDLPEEASRMGINSQRDLVDDSSLAGGRSNSLQTPAHILKSHSDTELTEQGYPGQLQPLSTSPGTEPRPRHPSTGDANYPRIQISDGSVTMSLGSQDLGSSYSSSPQHRHRSSENLHYDPERDKKGGEIRKSFNNAFSNLTKLTEKVKQNVKALDVMDDGDDWDNLSLKSGASSDDEEFVFLKLHNATEVPAFERHHSSSESVSVADSEGKDESPGTSAFSGLADRARGVVSVVSFRLVNTEAIVQMKGEDMSVSSQVYHLIPHEYGNVNLDKFHQKFTTANKESDEQLPLVADPPLKMRYQVGPAAEALAPSAADLGHLRAMVGGLRNRLCMSSVTHLVDLIEDEAIPPPMPMYITVSDCTFTLQNDGPPTHMTSPEPVPLDFHVDRLTLTRGIDGVFRVSTGPPRELDLPVHEGRQRSLSSTPPGVRGHDQRAVTPPGVRSYDGRPGTPPGVRAAYDQRPGTPPGGMRGHDPRPGTPPGGRPPYDRPSTPPAGRAVHDQRPGTPPGGRAVHDQRPLQEALRQIQGQATSLDRVKRENSALRDRIIQVEEELDHKLSQHISKEQYSTLQEENNSLRRQLEKIASMDGGFYQQENLQREVHHWREEAEAAEAVQRENAQLIQQLEHQQDEIHILKQERDSLLATLQLLQEELTASETMRSRGKSPLS